MTIGNVGGGTELDVLAEGELEELPEAAKVIQGRGPWRLAYERLRRDRAAVISAVIIVIIVACAAGAALFATITGHGVNQQFRIIGETPDGFPVGPGGKFWLGTDDQGRDVLVRIAYGARVSLLIGVVTSLITVTFGTIMGLMAGYFGRFVDTLISRIIDVTLSIPFLLFAVALAAVEGGGSILLVVIVLAGFGWSSVARIVRGQVLSIREREYIEAARSLGASSWRIMFIDILPNVIAQVIVYASLLIPLSIVGEATLSFLSIGVQPPTADWGAMIASAQQGGVYQAAWWFLVFPGLALLITTLAFNILGDGIRDAFDPRSDRLFV
ncbi:MAG TPA: ABC transporter permease [Mycobacteriales bacterium]|nr:ABC transporter permease [Mycobacteriales bacterium]